MKNKNCKQKQESKIETRFFLYPNICLPVLLKLRNQNPFSIVKIKKKRKDYFPFPLLFNDERLSSVGFEPTLKT